MIFNNLKNISEGSGERVILGYIYLADSQYAKFKIVADNQIEARRRAAEEKRFNEAVEPIDKLLTVVSDENSPADSSKDYPDGESAKSSEDSTDYPQIHQI
jgi:3-polyprenyl-4-hydroxybenzoate decarboxylase